MRLKQFATEADLARPLVAWLRDLGWDVYQEVACHTGGRRADIVAKKGSVLWVVETKLRLGWEVLSQAEFWLRYAHRVSIGVPTTHTAAERCCKLLGLGLLWAINSEQVHERVTPAFRRHVTPTLGRALREEHKTFGEAGNCLSQYYSPYKATCRALLDEVQRTPGILLKDLVAKVPHHYASPESARCSIAKWAEYGKLPGVRVERKGRLIHLYPAEAR